MTFSTLSVVGKAGGLSWTAGTSTESQSVGCCSDPSLSSPAAGEFADKAERRPTGRVSDRGGVAVRGPSHGSRTETGTVPLPLLPAAVAWLSEKHSGIWNTELLLQMPPLRLSRQTNRNCSIAPRSSSKFAGSVSLPPLRLLLAPSVVQWTMTDRALSTLSFVHDDDDEDDDEEEDGENGGDAHELSLDGTAGGDASLSG